MKLSITVPVFNVKEYLRQCIDSVNAAVERAACASEIELLLVDDGSTDGSSAVCDELGRKYPWIRVRHQDNRGVAAARNMALCEVAGEYVTWIDPDDLVSPEYFTSIFNALECGPDALLFDFVYMPGGTRYYRRASGSLPIDEVWRDLLRDDQLKSFLCCKIVRRELVPDSLFDENCAVMSDFEAMGRLFAKVRTVEYLHLPLYVYRRRVGSIVNQPVPERMMKMFRLALKRYAEADPRYRQDALSCAMYHAYHYCHMSAKFPSSGWTEEGRLAECRNYIRTHFFEALKDSRNSWYRKLQFSLVVTGTLGLAVLIRRLLPGGSAS